jgi:serine/threonine-protein kinase RsbW
MNVGADISTVDSDASVVRLRIPARAEYITLCRLALTGLSRIRQVPDETLADLKLALTEATSNSVRHAYSSDGNGHVDIVYELRDDRLAIEVADDGGGFEPAPGRNAEEAGLSEGGLGIAIIRAIADELEIESGPAARGSRLRFVKLLH